MRKVSIMPKFVTIGYGDQDGYNRTAKPIRDAAHKSDEKLVSMGVVMGIAGQAVQVRNPEARGVEVSEGAYLRSDMPIAGFAIIDAANIKEAIELVSKSPCAVAHGVVEVWPLEVSQEK
jgi:hypothetical protein